MPAPDRTEPYRTVRFNEAEALKPRMPLRSCWRTRRSTGFNEAEALKPRMPVHAEYFADGFEALQ